MANVKINDLPVTSAVDDNDSFPMSRPTENATKKVTFGWLSLNYWIPRSLFVNKGDLLVGTGGTTGAITKKSIGTDGQVLTADSAVTGGVKWADPSGGGDVAGETVAAASKSTPVDADLIPLVDSAASNVLKKLSWANLKTALATTFISQTLLTAKGDIIVRTASGLVRLAIGTNGQVLTADSTATEGLKWAAGGGGGAGTVTSVNGQGPDGGGNVTVGIADIANLQSLLDAKAKMETTGTYAAPTSITAAGGIGAPTSGVNSTTKFIKSNSGAVVISANPQIANGDHVGQEYEFIFTSDTDTLEFNNGNGLVMPSKFISEAGRVIRFKWGGTSWIQTYRQ